MSRTTSAANGGGITAELRNWARGCHSTEAAVELLIRARGERFVEPGHPWLRTDDRGITWLDAQVIGRHSHAVSSGAPQTLHGRTLARRRLSTQEFPTFDGL